MAGFVDRTGVLSGKPSSESKNPITQTLKRLSGFGLKFDDLVIKNSRAIGLTEDKIGWKTDPMGFQGGEYDDYGLFANLSASDSFYRKNISIFDKRYIQKVQDLRKIAQQDEIEEILDTLSDECIVYDDKNYFCQPAPLDIENLDKEIKQKIEDKLSENFKSIYQYFGFNNDISAWAYFKKFLIDGYLAFEIIYNKEQSKIIGFKELDPVSLEPRIDREGKRTWIQYKGQHNKERLLYDSQLIYISYSYTSSATRTSYVEKLVRSFNLLRIMETSRIIWAVNNASFKTKFIIPVNGKGRSKAKESLQKLMQSYRENVDFDADSGELKVNGKPMMAFNKEYWFPEGEGGSPQIETIGGDGPDLSDTDAMKYFRQKLYKVSKIPMTRFDAESGDGWGMNADGYGREEIKFSRFINRLRSVFQEILTKPLWLQMCLDVPEIREDDSFKSQISVRFNKMNVFDEMREIELLEKRLNFITTMKDSLVEVDANGNDVKYFASEFLVKRFLNMSEEDLKLNRRLKEAEEKEKLEKAKEENEAMM